MTDERGTRDVKLSVSGTWFNYAIFLFLAAVIAIRAAGGEISLNALGSDDPVQAAGLGVLCLGLLFFVVSGLQLAIAYLKAYSIDALERRRGARRSS